MINIYFCCDGETPSDKQPVYTLSLKDFLSKFDRSEAEHFYRSPVKYKRAGNVRSNLSGFREYDHVIAEIEGDGAESIEPEWKPGFYRLELSATQIVKRLGEPNERDV